MNFPYSPSKSAVLFTYENVNCAIDAIEVEPTQLQFGVVEITSPNIGQWMGPNATTSGNPCWTLETLASQLGPTAYQDPITKHTVNGLALDVINAMGSASLITNWIATMNATLAARFPTIPIPTRSAPPFTVESDAVAWLQTHIAAMLKVVNGVVS